MWRNFAQTIQQIKRMKNNYSIQEKFDATAKNCNKLFLCLKILAGDVITGFSGTQGGTTYSKNRYGAYKRQVGVHVNQNTPHQQTARERFSLNSSTWNSLTQAQRDTWITLAPTFSKIDVFGNNHPLSAPSLYQSLNSNLRKILASPITICPMPNTPASVVFNTIVPDVSLASITANLVSAVPAGFTGYLSASPILSPGITFNRNRYKFIQLVTNAMGVAVDITSAYQAIYQTAWLGNIGSQIMVKMEIVENNTGLQSASSKSFGLVIA